MSVFLRVRTTPLRPQARAPSSPSQGKPSCVPQWPPHPTGLYFPLIYTASPLKRRTEPLYYRRRSAVRGFDSLVCFNRDAGHRSPCSPRAPRGPQKGRGRNILWAPAVAAGAGVIQGRGSRKAKAGLWGKPTRERVVSQGGLRALHGWARLIGLFAGVSILSGFRRALFRSRVSLLLGSSSCGCRSQAPDPP